MTSLSKPRSAPCVRVDYEELIADYEKGLIDTLRGFVPATEYLESWVPDEDPVKSLCNIVEAAGSYGQDAISVFVGQEIARRVDTAALLEAARELGEARIESQGDGLIFEVTRITEWTERAGIAPSTAGAPQRDASPRRRARAEAKQTAPAPQPPAAAEGVSSIGPCYRQAVQDRLTRIVREQALADEEGTVRVEGSVEGVCLTLIVDPQTHVIRRAAHRGATGPVAQTLLDGLCELVEGAPIQEAGDHGVIRLEADFRDPSASPPVPGIVTPESADTAFRLPLTLIRGALQDYRERTNYRETGNEFDPGPSPKWRSLSDAERRARLARALLDICRKNGLAPNEVAVTAIEHDVRVVVELTGGLAAGDKQGHMIILEAGLKDMVDRRLELFLEELTDENRIRRLSQAGKPI